AYEKNVNIDPQSASWLNRMLVIGDPSYLQYSCYYTAQHICEMAEAANPDYTFIENDTAGFVSTINQGINQGVGFFTYRGYYGVSGWSPDQTFINGRRLPHSVILTCRTGCFAEDALSEEFIRLGTEANPSGGLTCIGMATGGTHTLFNNALISGIMGGIFTHKMRTMGEALLNGRLYLNSIYGVSEPVYTRSLAHWCNLMGDPTLEAWVGIPSSFNISVPDEIPFGTTILEIDITNALDAPVEGVCVTVSNPETAAIVAKAFTDASGRATLDLPTALGPEILITASQHNFKPFQATVPINDSGSLSYASHQLIDDGTQESFGNADGLAQAMETLAMNVSLGNFTAEDLQGLSATLSTEHPEVHVITEYVAYPDISAGELASGTQSFLFHLGFNIQPWEKIRFLLDVSDADGQEYHSVFYVDAYNARLAVSNYTVSDGSSGILDPGESSLLMLQVDNASTYPAFELMGHLRSLNDLLAIPDSVSYFGDILPQSQGHSMDGFQVIASDKLVPGMMIPCLLRLFNDHGYEQSLAFNLPIGSVSQNTPLGPDEFGYLIYDDTDTAFPDCPSYDWIEIVPALGGYGTIVHGLSDTGYSGTEGDSNSSHALMELELPFLFPFYGIYYNRITVCVNGFIVFGSTKNGEYRNAHIPGGQGPSPMIAVFWDDLYLPGGAGIYTYDDTENHIFIIQYHNLKNGFDQTSVEDFQLILYDPVFYPTGLGDGKIKIQYKTFNNVDLGGGGLAPLHGNYCTIGIKDHSNTRGLEYTYNNTYPQAAAPLGNERAILITTVPTLYNQANLILNELSISDENGNSILEPGETVELGVYLSNTGNLDASGVSVSLSSFSPYVTMFTQESGYPDIAAQGNAVNIIPFNFRVAEDCPGNTFLNFQCDVTIDGNSWSYPLSITVYRPEVNLHSYFQSDYTGNYSGNLDPGEEALLVVNFKNLTPVAVSNLLGNISCSNPYVTLLDTTQVLGTMLPRAISQLAFRFRISPTASVGDNITIYLSYQTEQMAAKISQLTLKVGYTGMFFDFENSNGNFIVGGGWEWGTDQDVGTHSGTKVLGTALDGPYDADANWILRSPMLYLGSNYFLEFWHYYDRSE
ncbi:MAG: C25 family cysteine peptidase, partial [Candidatus Cloacimonetes bacterium]|nr:C25 family cysteine peptidase [Candidatus Cloacimonadota bacterium]